jgi:hypothetical protein
VKGPDTDTRLYIIKFYHRLLSSVLSRSSRFLEKLLLLSIYTFILKFICPQISTSSLFPVLIFIFNSIVQLCYHTNLSNHFTFDRADMHYVSLSSSSLPSRRGVLGTWASRPACRSALSGLLSMHQGAAQERER